MFILFSDIAAGKETLWPIMLRHKAQVLQNIAWTNLYRIILKSRNVEQLDWHEVKRLQAFNNEETIPTAALKICLAYQTKH